ncbi:ciliogenesis and planar polarity effector 1 isoform X1 [Pygocentrus nattereri]|uniref:ciliogenesis and planar polarity effector 1 isoform X1 n=1 Tax=Pygocentrus nattereri TaxID=42514 RepID=UPI001890F3B2|nr:ciliogenesis and planar polarity effector 1 isoform X1 [Pygocentrus nattereri]XP_017567422.2 ciliogenesis and planar polarity effector 1 isoform X1 [Pygocentrus nattereri]XP_017567423.2 ciliogenesis and planar polarity effector 1 isoform X1 [Pygocentrus nattereri]XP_017567424.2 ciliogenesis and planar polarity effector 1 isoform X1 [Pygocentrus nattereri]
MEIKFEVLLSSSIKRKKPWPKFCWLGKEREGVFLLDDTRISEINLVSGQTKKKTPKLQPLLPRVLTMCGSQNGMWLAGILVSGELFLWNRDKDSLKMVTAVSAVNELASTGKATSPRPTLLVSGDGQRVLLVTVTGLVFLWECMVPQDLSSLRDGIIKGRWSQIASSENAQLPSSKDKEASVHSVFVQSQAVGDVCLSAFVFTSGEELIVTFLKIQWEQTWERKLSLEGYSVRWATKTYPLNHLVPACRPVKSRGALVPAFSPDGQLLAIILNQKDPRATQVLYISVQNFVTISSSLGGCGSKKLNIPSKYVRSYWVGCVSWSPGGLYLGCVLKRGSLLLLARLGGLVSLSTTGCDIEFGPAHFLPLHPLITYRPPVPLQPPDDTISSSSVSLRDPMRQRYSVTWHPRLPCLLVSDGYMVTMLKMPSQPSSASLMSSLLLDTAQGLERVRKVLGSEQPQVRSRLESMSTLKFTASLLALKEKASSVSTLPLFLQDAGGLKLTIEKAQVEDDDEDSDVGQYTRSVMEDGGRLEFASMFDTLHAQPLADPEDLEQGSSALLEELAVVRQNLLTAWALGVSHGGTMDQRERLLRYAVSCVIRLARVLRIALPVVQPYREDRGTWTSHVFDLLKSLLCFLPWDSPHKGSRSCLRIVVDLIQRFAHFFLPSSVSNVRSSKNFTAALVILQEASKSLDQTYTLPQKTVHQDQDDCSPCPSDMFFVPLLQESEEAEAVTSQLPLLNRPSNRLVTIWRELYKQALQYQAELYNQRNPASQSKELENISDILSQIQEALQRAGDHLEESPALHNITGEQHFILGEYSECVQAWRVQLWAERETVGPRTCFLETRYCLALLFGQLFQYRLREAQTMCDSLARRLQSQSGQVIEDDQENCDETDFGGWLPQWVNSEAACAVVQSLGRFMASYFTNQPLAIFPPHSVDILPPLHLPPLSGWRMVVLSQSRVAGAVRSQHLSEVWTVDYALELLLLGGLMPEAVWLAQRLGDWKTAASLSLAYTTYCRQHYDFSRLKWKELHIPAELQPGSIFQTQLESLMGCMTGFDGSGQALKTDTVEVEDMELLQASVQEILKASVMADVDVVSQPLTQLLDSAKEHASSLAMLVPPAFYLPAPPLYCPQPAPNTQDSVEGGVLALERELRCHVAGVLQRVLLLFRAAHCSRPAAQWYISSLRRCRQIFCKVRKDSVESKDGSLPEGLKKFTNRHGFFRLGHSGHGDMDSVTKQTIVCFRELCGLCWMLNVRDKLTVSCRKYQTARTKSQDSELTDVSVSELCEEALHWVCRLLPFSRFLGAEEILQDLALSLVAELPPIPMVAETLVRIFPDEEESVRVPLRDKYSSLMQRLRPCTVQTSKQATQLSGGEEEEERETMMLLIQDQRRQRCREERHLAKILAPLEQHLWERDEEEERGGAATILSRFSLGTSLSNSTLTDCERLLVGSEVDTADTLSEPLSPDLQARSPYSSKSSKAQDSPERLKIKRKEDRSSKSVTKGRVQVSVTEQGGDKDHSLPVVGTWLFELDDEEYLRFLELFFSYVLEKDSLDSEESELPLLSSFSSQLHDRELHSDTFDLLTALKRRKAGRKRDVLLPVFCAGHCFQTLPETPEPPPSIGLAPSILSETRTTRTSMAVQPPPGKQPGLFSRCQSGSQAHSEAPLRGSVVSAEMSSVQNSFPWTPQIERWSVKTISHPDVDHQLELDSKMEVQFPKLGRLLEWMLRWADRSILVTQPSRKKPEGAGEPVVIRAKASAPAVLFALGLLEQRFSAALLGVDKHCAQLKVPEMELTVAPVLQPDFGWKRERERSVDTGYTASGGTPITLPDLDHQQGHSSRMCESVEVQEDKSISHLSEHEDITSDSEMKTEDNRRTSELLPVSESQDYSSIVETLEGSFYGPNVSVQINTQSRTQSTHREQPLTLADLECPETTEDSSESHSEGGGIRHSTPVEPGKKTASRPIHELPKPASLQKTDRKYLPVSDPPIAPGTSSHPPSRALPQNGADTHPDPVRQLLQDELFRLVQLQQINFMSLMQVVGASFANLPLSQANPLLAQLSVPPSQATAPVQAQAQASAPTVAQFADFPQNIITQTQNVRQENADKQLPASESGNRKSRAADQQPSSVEAEPVLSPCEERSSPIDSGLNIQEIQQLTIRSDWSRGDQTARRTFISPSQGLLATVENQAPPTVLSNGRANEHPVFKMTTPVMQGLKLLQLPPPQSALLCPPPPVAVREAWGPQPLHLNLNQYESRVSQETHSGLKRAEEDSRRCAVSTAPPRINLHQYPKQAQLRFSEGRSVRETEREAIRLPPAPQPGLPLLRFPPATQTQHIQLPHVPFSAPVKQATLGPAAVGHYPRLHLLRAEPDPPSAYSAPPVRTPPRLIPLEELMSWAAGRRQLTDSKLQLLRAAQVTQRKSKDTPSSKRLKRREAKKRENKREEKPVVSFRPEDSIIPPSQVEEEETTPDGGYAIPLGSFDSMLSGQRLLDEAYSTSAELHAFAATQKRPPEIQDACTNTDPASPHTVTDKAVSAQLPASPGSASTRGTHVVVTPVVPPDVFLNLRFPREVSHELPEGSDPAASNVNMNMDGRRFINVIDLEDGSLLQDLLPSQTPAQTTSSSPPTAAQLHLLAASVTNSAPTKAEILTEEQTDELPGLSANFSPLTAVSAASEPTGDPVTVRVLMDLRAPEKPENTERPVDRALLSRSQVSVRLAEMDAQLAALQSIADHMDQEFANTRLLVNTIETLVPAVMPSEEDEPYSRTLKVTKEAKNVRYMGRHVGQAHREEKPKDGGFLSSAPRDNVPLGLRGRSTVHPVVASTQSFVNQVSTSPTVVSVKPEQPPWNDSQELVESLLENSNIPADKTLGLSGLSDVADILGDLVKEGALSPSALHLSPSVTRQSRLEEQQKRSMIDEERKELRSWMRKKQRERLVEYRKQREEKREMERKPFTPPVSVNPSSRDLAINKKIKEERDKQVLLEHHSQRAREACSLITDLLTAPLSLPTASSSTTVTQVQDSRLSLSRSTRKNKKSPPTRRGRARSASALGRTVVLQRRSASGPPGTLSSRLGLHRPASALPGDRLSQVTRRGMLTDTRGRPRLKITAPRPQTRLNESPAAQQTLRQRESYQVGDTDERDVVSPWDTPLKIRRILGLEDHDVEQDQVEYDQDRLETLSESTGSMLSKLDWAAIERIVAEEEEV